MGKVKLLLDVVGDLRSLADSLQSVADAMADGGRPEEEPQKAKVVWTIVNKVDK